MPKIGDSLSLLPEILTPVPRPVEFRFRVDVDPKGGLFATPTFVYAGSIDDVPDKLDELYGIMRPNVDVKSITQEVSA